MTDRELMKCSFCGTQQSRESPLIVGLGSVAVAMVLSRAELSKTTHRVNGSDSLADTTQNRLCLGTTGSCR